MDGYTIPVFLLQNHNVHEITFFFIDERCYEVVPYRVRHFTARKEEAHQTEVTL